MNRYVLLALTLLLTLIFLFCLYFLLSVGPAAMRLMEQDVYAACVLLSDSLDFAQSLLLVFGIALIVIHLFYVLNRHFGRPLTRMGAIFTATPFMLTREVIGDALITVVVLMIVGGIELVQQLFDCVALSQAA